MPLNDFSYEILINGVWTDITSDVYQRNDTEIVQGYPNESGDLPDPARATFTLNNRLGKYSPRNPLGPYFGKLRRNTPIRITDNSVTPGLDVSYSSGWVFSSSSASLNITGDIDVRAAGRWPRYPETTFLGSDFVRTITWARDVSGTRYWALSYWAGAGKLRFLWKTSGGEVSAYSTVAIPTGVQLAVRAVLDVNNGAGGYTVTFYTSDTVNGSWTQLGAPVVGVGTTAISSGADRANVESTNLAGNVVTAVQVRSGIGGTVVANPDFTATAYGDFSLVDSAGRTWAPATFPVYTTDAGRRRFTGEVVEWPNVWDVTGNDAYAPVECASIRRRTGHGRAAPTSAFARKMNTWRTAALPATTSSVAYWPLSTGDSSGSSPEWMGGAPAKYLTARGSDFGVTSLVRSVPDGITLAPNESVDGPCQTVTQATPRWDTSFIAAVPNGGRLSVNVYCDAYTSITIIYDFTADTITYYNNGTSISSDVPAYVVDDSRARMWHIQVIQSGANLNVYTYVSTMIEEVSSSGVLDIPVLTLDAQTIASPATTLPPATHVTVTNVSTNGGMIGFGHLAVYNNGDSDEIPNAAGGLPGEYEIDRIPRIATDADIDLDVILDPYEFGVFPKVWHIQLGPQEIDDPAATIDSIAVIDAGLLVEPRDGSSQLRLLERGYIQGKNRGLPTFYRASYSGHEVMPPFAPVDDDQLTRNRMTISVASGGGEVTDSLDDGAMSTLAPEDGGVGLYAGSETLNVHSVGDAGIIAGWQVSVGTVDAARWPEVTFDFNNPEVVANATLTNALKQIDVGSVLILDDMDDLGYYDPVYLLVRGYTETVNALTRQIKLNCVDWQPYRALVLEDDRFGLVDSGSSELATGVNSTATSLSVSSAADELWDTAITSVPIMMDGEKMTLTAVSGASSPQTFTVTRSVNGVVKSHSAGESIYLYDPSSIAL